MYCMSTYHHVLLQLLFNFIEFFLFILQNILLFSSEISWSHRGQTISPLNKISMTQLWHDSWFIYRLTEGFTVQWKPIFVACKSWTEHSWCNVHRSDYRGVYINIINGNESYKRQTLFRIAVSLNPRVQNSMGYVNVNRFINYITQIR